MTQMLRLLYCVRGGSDNRRVVCRIYPPPPRPLGSGLRFDGSAELVGDERLLRAETKLWFGTKLTNLLIKNQIQNQIQKCATVRNAVQTPTPRVRTQHMP